MWDAYQQAVSSLKIVRRVVTDPGISPPLVKGTVFDGMVPNLVDSTIDALQEHLDDQAVLSLYAAFESALRGHLAAQAVYLKTHVSKPDSDFAIALAEEYESWCDEGIRMDRVAHLFQPTVDQTLISQIGQIRKYRHWLAHGKRRSKPPQTTPTFTYGVLDALLSKL